MVTEFYVGRGRTFPVGTALTVNSSAGTEHWIVESVDDQNGTFTVRSPDEPAKPPKATPAMLATLTAVHIPRSLPKLSLTAVRSLVIWADPRRSSSA